jgi:hypothetical protein
MYVRIFAISSEIWFAFPTIRGSNRKLPVAYLQTVEGLNPHFFAYADNSSVNF